jgi:acetyl-CoA acetyltransferase
VIHIAGTGQTAYRRRSGRSVPDMATEAGRAALADAALEASALDAVIPLGGELFTEDLIAGLGLPGTIMDATPPPGGNAAVTAVKLAESLIVSGDAESVLITLARNGSSAHRIGTRTRQLPGQQFREQLEAPHGWSVPAQWYAMMCRRHMAEHGTTKAQLAAVALTANQYAQANPSAMRYGRPLTAEQYETADMIADPYQRYDCCLETDGAAAVVVTASRPGSRAVRVLAVESARPESPDDLTNRRDWQRIGLSSAAPAAYERAGISPADLDAAMIYDCFTFEVIHQLEEAGFCPRGEGGPLAASGALGPRGRLPVNTHGGLLAEGHLGGLNHVLEAVRQLRGEAGARQLPRARLIGVTGWGDWGDGSMAILASPALVGKVR